MRTEYPKTLFIDIDGTLLHHHGIPNMQARMGTIVLEGVIEKLGEWNMLGHQIILVTGRKESERSTTIKQLSDAHIEYDMLIMGLPRGKRVIINDMKPDSNEPTAIAVSIERNTGIKNINI